MRLFLSPGKTFGKNMADRWLTISIPVLQRHCQPCCHRQQRRSYHQDPWQLDQLGMDHGHGESYKLQSQAWPHQYPLSSHIACWERTDCSSSPRRGSICHQTHKTTCNHKKSRWIHLYNKKIKIYFYLISKVHHEFMVMIIIH